MRKKKLNIKKILFLTSICFLVFILIQYSFMFEKKSSTISNYEIIMKSKNEKYLGIGQQELENQDGYFTTFTTEDTNKKIYKEYKQNCNSSWSYKEYWGGIMADTGCGITVMSIILSGYNKDYTPERLREMYYPVLNYEQLSNELSNTFSIENSDFYYDSLHLSNNYLISHLKTNRPIIICVWNKPSNNRWTTESHYMALLATDNNDMVYVSNPNGGKCDSKSSGWYNINEISPYIAKALFIESYK